MTEFFSIVSAVLLLVVQSAVAISGNSNAVASLLVMHLASIAVSAAYWLRRNNTCLPPYSIATVVTDSPKGGKVFSTERDSVLVGSGVAGLFFGGPTGSRLLESPEPIWQHAILLLLVTVTPVSVYINWYFLRRVLWLLFLVLFGWSSWMWLSS